MRSATAPIHQPRPTHTANSKPMAVTSPAALQGFSSGGGGCGRRDSGIKSAPSTPFGLEKGVKESPFPPRFPFYCIFAEGHCQFSHFQNFCELDPGKSRRGATLKALLTIQFNCTLYVYSNMTACQLFPASPIGVLDPFYSPKNARPNPVDSTGFGLVAARLHGNAPGARGFFRHCRRNGSGRSPRPK